MFKNKNKITSKEIMLSVQLTFSNSNKIKLPSISLKKLYIIYFLQFESLCNSNKILSPLRFELERNTVNVIITKRLNEC